jgi:hypothetical protein
MRIAIPLVHVQITKSTSIIARAEQLLPSADEDGSLCPDPDTIQYEIEAWRVFGHSANMPPLPEGRCFAPKSALECNRATRCR